MDWSLPTSEAEAPPRGQVLDQTADVTQWIEGGRASGSCAVCNAADSGGGRPSRRLPRRPDSGRGPPSRLVRHRAARSNMGHPRRAMAVSVSCGVRTDCSIER
jgi:hypothetical protein